MLDGVLVLKKQPPSFSKFLKANRCLELPAAQFTEHGRTFPGAVVKFGVWKGQEMGQYKFLGKGAMQERRWGRVKREASPVNLERGSTEAGDLVSKGQFVCKNTTAGNEWCQSSDPCDIQEQ